MQPKPKIDIGAAFEAAKTAFVPNVIPFVIAAAIAFLLNFVPFVGGLFAAWGLIYMALRALPENPVEFSDLWTGIMERGIATVLLQSIAPVFVPFLPMLVGGLLFGGLTALKMPGIGAILFGLSVLASIYVSIRCYLALPALVADRTSGWEAVQRSWAITGADLGGSIGLMILVMVLNAAASALFSLPLLLSVPFSMLIIAAAYEQVRGEV